ncbi:MAG: LamG domain-containing protein, partial [Ferruginibacter sp.]
MKKILLHIIFILILPFVNAQTPVAYYPFSGNANDAIGSLNGTVNGATLTTDRFGNANSAYSFDGNDFINTTSVATLNTDNWAITAWVNPSSINQADATIAINGFDNGNAGNGYALLMSNGNGTGAGNILTGLFSGQSYLNGGSTFNTANAWYFVAMVRESGVTKFYLNGVQSLNTSASAPAMPSGSLRIGSCDGNRFWNGKIDEVKIYNTALNAAQVQSEYSASAYGSQFGNSVQLTAGNDDYIEILTSTLLSLSGNVTVEAWINIDPPSTSNNVFMNCVNGGFGYALFPSVFATVNSGNPENANNGVSIPSGSWHHVAGVKSDAGINSTFNYYVDGIVTGQGFGNANAMRGGGSNDICRIGRTTVNSENFKGRLDEIRVWNTARTQGEIAANMLFPLSGNETGLIAYYDMNRSGQGAGLTVDNKANATGAALNGTTVGTATTPVFGPGFTQQKPGSGNSIEFSTSNSTSIIANNIALDNKTFSIDFWLKKKVLNNTDICISQGTLSGNSGLAIGYYNGSFLFSFYANDLYATTTDDLNWHHWTCVYDKDILSPENNRFIYKDGILVGQDRSNDFTGTGDLNIGVWLSGAVKGLDGQLDEVRIWNTALTQTQIRDRMCHKITSSDALYGNLVAYYNFDESTGNTAFDGTANANNGTLINNATRVTSGAAIGNASAQDYINATKTASIAHASGETFSVTSTSGNPDGMQVYRIDEQPNTLNGAVGVGTNNKYFGVFQAGG